MRSLQERRQQSHRRWSSTTTVVLLLWCAATAAAAAVSAAPASDPRRDYLSNLSISLVTRCQLSGPGGVRLFSPDASASYGAQWTRDFAYMLAAGGGAAFSDADEPTVRAAVALQFARGQRADGCFADRVQTDGTPVFSPGGTASPFADHAIDNMPFAGRLLAAYAGRFAAVNRTAVQALFCAAEPQVRRALDFLQTDPATGLVWNDPDRPNCTYGFTDTVAKQGGLLFSSLLVVDAAQQMANWSAAFGCGNSSQYAAEAAAMATAVSGGPLAAPVAQTGFFLACTQGANSLPDVWGSAYAVQLGVATPAQTAAVVAQLANATNGLYQSGQVRHLPAGVYWGKCFLGGCPAHGTYQNGAFWATPLSWVLPVLAAHGQAPLAESLLNATVANFQAIGPMECVDNTYHGVTDYVDSGTNALAGLLAISS